MSFACLIDSLGLHVINVIICVFIFFFPPHLDVLRNQIKTLAFSDLEVIILLITCFYYFVSVKSLLVIWLLKEEIFDF